MNWTRAIAITAVGVACLFVWGLLVALLVAWARPAAAHEWYDPVCCDERDCAPLAEDAIREGDGGWYVTGPDGREHFVPYGKQHPMISPDGQAHACFGPATGNFMTRALPGGRRVMCLHVPGGGV